MRRTVYRTCTLCEATCGLLFEVDGDRILSVRPDPDDPISKGYACPKGMAIAKVHDDPDRLRRPMRRVGPDRFEPIGWEEALDRAAAGLRSVLDRHGRDSVAAYWGNPVVHNHGALLLRRAVNRILRTRNVYGAGSQDTSPRFATSFHLYGSSLSFPVPDLDRTDFFLCIGANPVVSNGSVMTAPDVRGRLRALRRRVGKLVVVDPRRSETAEEADEYVPIRPGTDAALLFAMASLIVRAGRASPRAAEQANGLDTILQRLAALDLDAAARFTGVPLDQIVRLAREFEERPSSVAYSRVGVCNSRFGTLGTYATDLLNVIAGRLGAVGGAMFPTPALDVRRILQRTGDDGHGRWRTRVRGLPETLGELPSAALAEEIETPGPGQVRGLFTFAGNPVLSAPNGTRTAAALGRLKFMVSVDLYVNETTRYADLILPPAWSLADEHVDFIFPLTSVRNAVRCSPPVVPKPVDERHDWEILLSLVRRLGGGPTAMPVVDSLLRVAERFGVRWTPRRMVALLLRSGAFGKGLWPWRRGLSMRELEASQHGIDLGPLEPGVAHGVLHKSGRVELAPKPILDEWRAFERALVHETTVSGLLLIGRREIRTNNSWMHNVPSLVSGAERCLLFVHPKDAILRGIADGEQAVLESRVHRATVRVRVTEEVTPGVVSLPHGWGHATAAPWQRVAGRRPGVSVNDWTDGAEVENVVGQSIL
ncbi:MAG TPA: dehydrogenase, partial [Deltaproteobacteria bacterium]|nr:dehydrogenase [Deltaproteobacteria bacterium]